MSIHAAPSPQLATPRPGTQARARLIAERAADLLPLFDFALVLLASWLSLHLPSLWSPANALAWSSGPNMKWVAAAIAPFILYNRRFADLACTGDKAALAHDLTRRFMAYLGIVAVIGYASRWHEAAAPSQLAVWGLYSLLLIAGSRVLLAQALRSLAKRGLLIEAVAVVSAGPLADQSILHLGANARLYGLFDDRAAPIAGCLHQADGKVEDLIERAREQRPDRILIALPAEAEQRLLALIEQLRPLGIPLDLCQQIFSPLTSLARIGYVGDYLPVTLLSDRPIRRWSTVLKASKDVTLASMMMLMLLPVLACIALAVKLDSPGPVLFRQLRYGYKGREFEIYKFRTMRPVNRAPDEGLQQTVRGDARITRVGRVLRKTSLDELPQIFNVIRGSMSLVGPRPHAVNMRTEQQLGHEITDLYPHRYQVKPGITGWSQVNGARGATDTAEQVRQRVELDLHYIEHWSLLLDLKILSRTVREVLRGTNAY